jgi:hypothetical protein
MVVRPDGRIRDAGDYPEASHLEHEGDDVCVVQGHGEPVCHPQGKHLQESNLASACRYVATPSSLNLAARFGESVTITIRATNGCRNGRLITAGTFLSLSTFSIGGNLATVRVTAGPTTTPRGEAIESMRG